MRVIGKTDIGRGRAENQDNFRCGNQVGCAAWGVVCDGMGGAENGKQASTVAVECIESQLYDHLQKGFPEQGIKNLVLDSIQLANERVYECSGRGEHVMGTTVVCAVVRSGRLHVAHVGDSRAYLFFEGKLRQITKDHSIVQELIDQGALSAEAANRHPEKNVITRALGVDEVVEISYFETDMPPGAVIVLCTDGLTNMVEGERIAEVLAEKDFYDVPSELVNDALHAGGNDNITVLLMQRTQNGENV